MRAETTQVVVSNGVQGMESVLERLHTEGRRQQRDIGMFQSTRGCEVVWYLIATRETATQRAALVFRR